MSSSSSTALEDFQPEWLSPPIRASLALTDALFLIATLVSVCVFVKTGMFPVFLFFHSPPKPTNPPTHKSPRAQLPLQHWRGIPGKLRLLLLSLATSPTHPPTHPPTPPAQLPLSHWRGNPGKLRLLLLSLATYAFFQTTSDIALLTYREGHVGVLGTYVITGQAPSYPPIHPPTHHPPTHLPTHPSIHPPTHLPTHPPAHPLAYSICLPSTHTFTHTRLYIYIYIGIVALAAYTTASSLFLYFTLLPRRGERWGVGLIAGALFFLLATISIIYPGLARSRGGFFLTWLPWWGTSLLPPTHPCPSSLPPNDSSVCLVFFTSAHPSTYPNPNPPTHPPTHPTNSQPRAFQRRPNPLHPNLLLLLLASSSWGGDVSLLGAEGGGGGGGGGEGRGSLEEDLKQRLHWATSIYLLLFSLFFLVGLCLGETEARVVMVSGWVGG